MKFINTFPTATPAQLQTHDTLNTLWHLMPQSNFVYLADDILVSGNSRPTADSIGVLMVDDELQACNLAVYPLSGAEPFLVNDNLGAFLIGTQGEIIASPSLADITAFYAYLNDDFSNYRFIMPFNERYLAGVVKSFSQKQRISIYGGFENDYANEFNGYNVKSVSTFHTLQDTLYYELIGHSGLQAIENMDGTEVKLLQVDEWGELQPLNDTPLFNNPYPINAFTGVLHGAVTAIAYHAQTPLSMAGQAVLGALSSMGQCHVNAPFGHEHKPASLFLLTEGESGAGKTQANKLAYYAIYQHEKTRYQSYVADISEWQAQKDSLKGKELSQFLQDEPKPNNPKQLVNDITIESLLDRFIFGTNQNISWVTDEAGQFFGGYSLKSDGVANALSSLTKLYSDGTASRERSQRSNHATPLTTAYDVRLTIDLAGQNAVIKPAMCDEMMNGQGFLARCLLSFEPSLIGERVWNSKERLTTDPKDDPRLIAFWQRCYLLLDPPPNERNNERVDLPFGENARQYLADFQQFIETRQKVGKDLANFRAFASRMAENATRIATLFAFFDCQKAVNVEYLQRAFLLVEYSINERLRYLDIPNGKNECEELIEWIINKAKAKNTNVLDKPYITQNAPNRLRGKKIHFLLDDLESMGYIKQEKDGRKKLVKINPCLF